jgi:hypothetical protein
MFSKDTLYRRKDWLQFHSSSKVWSGRFAQVPASERVKMPKPKKRKKNKEANAKAKDDDADDDDDQEKGEDDADDDISHDTEESIVAGAAEGEKEKAGLFRREQIPARYLIDMLLRYGRAWGVMPAMQGLPAKRVVVIDPFCGSCSTARAAWATDCDFIGVDIDPLAKTVFQGIGDKVTKATTWAKMVASMQKRPKVYFRELVHARRTYTTIHAFSYSFAGLRSSAVLSWRRIKRNDRLGKGVR